MSCGWLAEDVNGDRMPMHTRTYPEGTTGFTLFVLGFLEKRTVRGPYLLSAKNYSRSAKPMTGYVASEAMCVPRRYLSPFELT